MAATSSTARKHIAVWPLQRLGLHSADCDETGCAVDLVVVVAWWGEVGGVAARMEEGD